MPLDGLAVVADTVPPPVLQPAKVHSPQGLRPLLASLGIEPVPTSVLHAHKQAELARHPGSFFWRHPDLFVPAVMISSVITFMGSLVSTIKLDPASSLGTGLSLGALVMAVIGFGSFFKLVAFTHSRAPAEWRERTTYHFHNMPPALRQLGERVHQAAEADATISFRIGTLYQESRVLDPYLMVLCYNAQTRCFERACLGIWDGRKIIHIAKPI